MTARDKGVMGFAHHAVTEEQEEIRARHTPPFSKHWRYLQKWMVRSVGVQRWASYLEMVHCMYSAHLDEREGLIVRRDEEWCFECVPWLECFLL